MSDDKKSIGLNSKWSVCICCICQLLSKVARQRLWAQAGIWTFRWSRIIEKLRNYNFM